MGLLSLYGREIWILIPATSGHQHVFNVGKVEIHMHWFLEAILIYCLQWGHTYKQDWTLHPLHCPLRSCHHDDDESPEHSSTVVAPQGWQGYLLDPLLALGAQVPRGVIVLPKRVGDLITHEHQVLLLDAEC